MNTTGAVAYFAAAVIESDAAATSASTTVTTDGGTAPKARNEAEVGGDKLARAQRHLNKLAAKVKKKKEAEIMRSAMEEKREAAKKAAEEAAKAAAEVAQQQVARLTHQNALQLKLEAAAKAGRAALTAKIAQVRAAAGTTETGSSIAPYDEETFKITLMA